MRGSPPRTAPKRHAATVTKKPAAQKKSKATKAAAKLEEDSEDERSDGSEGEDEGGPASHDSLVPSRRFLRVVLNEQCRNDADMELLRVAFACECLRYALY